MYKDVVAIIGMPRSGTSWLGQLFDSSPNVAYRLEPIFSYAFKNAVNLSSTKEDYISFFNDIYNSSDPFMLQTEKRETGIYPKFRKNDVLEFLVFKTTRYHHMTERILQLLDNVKIISIVRNPCAAIYSWLNARREFPSTADPMTEWRHGACRNISIEEFWGFEAWKAVTLQHLDYSEKYPDRFRIIKYEDLVESTSTRVKDLFNFVGIEFEAQSQKFIDECHSRHDCDSYSVFKSKDVVHDWERKLDIKIIEEIYQDLDCSPLSRFL